MRPETIRFIAMANACLPNPETWRRMEGLIPDLVFQSVPQQADRLREIGEIGRVSQCIRRTHDPQQCLQRQIGSQTIPSPSMSFYNLCPAVYRVGERINTEGDDNLVHFAHGVGAIFFVDPSFSGMPREEQQFLYALVNMYSESAIEPAEFEESLVFRGGWRERIALYNNTGNVEDLDRPFRCANLQDFREESIQIFGYSIPVFFLRSQQMIRRFLRWDLQSGLEIIQGFFHPDDLRRILRPGNGQPDFSLYISGPFTNVELGQINSNSAGQPEAALVQCGLNTQNVGGLSDGEHNRIWIRAYAGSSTSVQTAPALNFLSGIDRSIDPSQYATTGVTWSNLFHEFGHAIAYNLLRNTSAWQNIQTFFNWTHGQIEAHPNQPELIPNYSSYIVRAGNQVTLFPPRSYGNTDVDQFFAELVEEYFKTESEGRGPDNPYFRARRRILQNFFGPRLNLDAFTPQNINAAFLAERLTIRVQGETPRPAPSAPARVTPSPRQIVRPPAARAAPVQTGATPQSFDTSGFEFRAYYSRDRYGRSGGGVAANIASRRTGGVNWGVGLTLTGFEESSGNPSGYFAFEGGLRTPPGPVENPFFHLEGFFRIGAFLSPDQFLLGLGARGVLNPFSSRFQVFVGGLLAFQGSNLWADWQVGLGGHFY